MTEFQFAKRIILREYPGAMALLVVNELIGVALMLLGLGTIIPFLAGLLGGSGELPGPIGEVLAEIGIYQWSNIQILWFLVGLMTIRIMLDAARVYIAGWIGVRLNRTIKESMNNTLAKIDWLSFSGIDQGKYLQCMIAESSLARGAVSDLAAAFAYGLITTLLLAWMASYSFNMFMIVCVLGGAFMWTNRRLMQALRLTSRQRIESMSEMNVKLSDFRHIFKTLFAENLVMKMVAAINSLIRKIASIERRQLLFSVLVDHYVVLFGLLIVTGMSLAHFAFEDSNGAALLFDLILLQRIASYFGSFQVRRKSMLQKIPSYEACLEMMRLPYMKRQERDEKIEILNIGDGIRVDNASFSYEGERRILKSISLDLPDKGLIYFIGPSGSGKTTLMDLIIGILPSEADGKVLIGGNDLKELDAASWSRLIAYVPQDAYILGGTLREYLTFGCENVTDEQIWLALKQADAERIVAALSKGLDSIVRSGGGDFSGGERHRLSIARALVRKVKVLFLDEPSSAVDKESERAIFDTLKELAGEILIIVITHSKDVIRDTDSIYLLDNGELIWSGRNAEFMKHDGKKMSSGNVDPGSIT